MPQSMLNKLPADAKKIYEDAYQSGIDKGWDESKAAMYAIGAVKQAGFRKNEKTGMWVKMAEPISILFGEPVTDGEWVEASCTGDYIDKNGRPVSITDDALS